VSEPAPNATLQALQYTVSRHSASPRESVEFPTCVKEVGSVPFSMTVGCGLIGVASLEGRPR
jgi:hypothetical protein